jgi:prepilin-type N-terminal cleavage/methylation domain-containing protein
MRLQRAFTFPELLIGVAVLAMLAAAAIPRFIAINRDVRAAAVEALAANVRSSARLTNRIWRSSNRPPRLTVDDQMLEMRHGFPTENSISGVVVNNGDFIFQDGYFKHRELLSSPGCAVLYIPPTSPEIEPVVISYTEGC